MKRRYAALLAVALVSPAVAGAQSTLPGLIPTACGPVVFTAPFAAVQANSTCVNLSSLIALDQTSGLFRLSLERLVVGDGLLTNLNASFDQDPFITFGANTSNLTSGPTTYSFFFGTPIVPDFYTRATSTGAVSVTSGAAGSATVAQNGANTFITSYGTNGINLFPLGVNIGTGTCTAGAASNSCVYPPPSGGPAQNTFAPTFLNNLELTLTYTQTDAQSQVGWTGRVDVFSDRLTVPEPGTLALVLTGIVGVLGAGAVRRRAAH